MRNKTTSASSQDKHLRSKRSKAFRKLMRNDKLTDLRAVCLVRAIFVFLFVCFLFFEKEFLFFYNLKKKKI